MNGGGQGRQRADLTVGPRILGEHAEHRQSAGGRPQCLRCRHLGQVRDDDLDPQRTGPGRDDRQGLRERVDVDEQDRVVGHLRRAPHEGHRLGGRRRLVQQRGTSDRQPGEVGHHGLEVEQRLQAPLGDLRLIGGVCRVPGRVLQDLTRDHGRADRAVVAEPNHGTQHPVAPSQTPQLANDGRLGLGGREVERHLAADRRRQCRVDERLQRRLPDDLKHRGDGGIGGTDVPADERGQRAAGGGVGRGGGGVLRHTGLRGDMRDRP
jgi:hypothetical protein